MQYNYDINKFNTYIYIVFTIFYQKCFVYLRQY
jgi:hypothetical protein